VKKFSILTATYNRESKLHALYESLCMQTFEDFEWIVVDDGSVDNTASVVKSWCDAKLIDIQYVKQGNGGKHRALNRGMSMVNGDWVAIIDSDDSVTPDCLERVARSIEKANLDLKTEIAGVVFLSKYASGKVVGSSFPHKEYIGKTYEYYSEYKLTGDKFDFYRSSVLREFPFPEFYGENFLAEGIVWNRINKKYDCLFVNEALQIVEYQEDGLSGNSIMLRIKSPNGAAALYSEGMTLNVPVLKKLRYASNYYRFKYHGGVACAVKGFSWLKLVGACVGLGLYMKDKLLFSGALK